MACNCKHMEQEIAEYREQLGVLRKLFIKRMTVDSETTDRRKREYNQAIFHYEDPDYVDAWNKALDKLEDCRLKRKSYDDTYPVWENMDMQMVLVCFDNAVKDWRKTFCDVETCRRK